jgi:hypothetical protein
VASGAGAAAFETTWWHMTGMNSTEKEREGADMYEQVQGAGRVHQINLYPETLCILYDQPCL